MLAIILAVAQVSAPQTGAPTPSPMVATAVVGARAAADSFVRVWTYHWTTSQLIQQRLPVDLAPPASAARVRFENADAELASRAWFDAVPVVELRHHIIHCHPDGTSWHQRLLPFGRSGVWKRLDEYIIPSGMGKRAVCPSWFQSDGPTPWDERLGIDQALLPSLRPIVARARQELLEVLDVAAKAYPTDEWVSGQRVRFSIDQGDTTRALRAVAECAAGPSWCGTLAGYVEYVRGNVARADSMFVRAIAAMPPNEACVWTDLEAILEPADAKMYAPIPCAERPAINERIWWLSDPLYLEPGNERRAEHFARTTLATLRAATVFHERWDMRVDGGGRAIAEMIVRYGWPSLSVWGGTQEDASHLSYLGGGSAEHERFATAEYAGPRFHTVPSWRAIANPYYATPFDWELTETSGRQRDPEAAVWWPREHYARPAGPLVQLWEQAALLRRDTTVLFAVGAEIRSPELEVARGDTMRGALIFSTGPNDIRRQPAAAVAGGLAIVQTTIPPLPQIVSLELAGDRPSGVVARARLGVRPPPPLSTMQPGETAISEPVFTEAAPTGSLPWSEASKALPRMLGTTLFRGLKRVGVYWETYGVRGGDSVDISLHVERREAPPGLFRRFAARLGVVEKTDNGLMMMWHEPSPEHVVTMIPGRVPIQGRGLSIDISELAPGNYVLVVSVTKPGGIPVTSARDFAIK